MKQSAQGSSKTNEYWTVMSEIILDKGFMFQLCNGEQPAVLLNTTLFPAITESSKPWTSIDI